MRLPRSALSAEEAEVCGRLLEFRFKASPS